MEGEYNIPTPTHFELKRSFDIAKDGLYQVDIDLTAKPAATMNFSINQSLLEKVSFKYNEKTKTYSTVLVQLSKGRHLLKILAKQEMPIARISFAPVKNPAALAAFAKHQDSQYGYLRAFIGNRRDDGQELQALKQISKVTAPLNNPQTIEFTTHIDDYPLPAHDPTNKNYLANLLHIGLWNTPWNSKKNTNIVIHSIEFESNVSPVWPPKTHTDIFIDSQSKNEKQYARAILANFLPKAYRKKISDDELNRHLGFWQALRPHHNSFESTIKEVLAISLSSPQFLYISEPEGTKDKNLTEFELASRLSYFLWNTMPDDQLMTAAKNKTLKSNLKQHIKRMIQDHRSFNFSKTFASQWLDIERLERVVVDSRHARGYNLDH